MYVDIATAGELFATLPAQLQLPSLCPAYVEADAKRDPALAPLFVAWRRGDSFLMHSVHEASVPGDGSRDWQSPYGYGGPLAQGMGEAELAEAWPELDCAARDRQVVAEFVRFHPLAGNHRDYPGTVREDRSVVAIELNVADLLSSYSGRARTAVRRAEKGGLRPRSESPQQALAQFPNFYREAMRGMNADPSYLFGDAYFAAILALPQARVLSIVLDERPVSMGLFLFGPVVAEYALSATTPAGRAEGATNLLVHVAASRARDEGLARLYLGGGTDGQPDNPLLRFKASFAAPSLLYRTGHRIHDALAYERLRERHMALARTSRRVLFYRG